MDVVEDNDFVAVPMQSLLSSENSRNGGGEEVRVSRRELVRLLADGLRDLGFSASAIALETESGFPASSSAARQFLDLLERKAYESALEFVDGLPFRHGELGKRRCKNLIVQERYLDSLLNDRIEEAISRLHEEVYFLHFEDEQELSELASLLACPTKDDLLRLSGNLRTKQIKRFRSSTTSLSATPPTTNGRRIPANVTTVTECVRALLDSEAVVPPNRLLDLLGQSLARQLSESSATQEVRRFNTEETLPLLRQIREVEERRNMEFTPSPDCFQSIQIDPSVRGLEVWCVSFHPDGSQFAVGLRSGDIIVFAIDGDGRAVESARFEMVCGSNRPMSSIDWNSPNGVDILCVSCQPRQQAQNSSNRRRSTTGSGSSLGEDDGDDDGMEEVYGDEGEDASLVRILSPTSSRETKARPFPVHQAKHSGRPLARWVLGSQVVTTGPDGWMKLWKFSDTNKTSFTCTRVTKVERVVDLAVTSRGGDLVFLACADAHIRAYSASTGQLVCTAGSPDSIVSISVGFNSLVASMKNQTLSVWNLSTLTAITTSAARAPSVSLLPHMTMKGFSRKRFILKPCVGEGDFFCTGSEDGNVHVWSSRLGTSSTLSGVSAAKEIVVLKGHTAPVNEVAFSPTRPGMLVSCSDDGSVRVWTRRVSGTW